MQDPGDEVVDANEAPLSPGPGKLERRNERLGKVIVIKDIAYTT